MGKNNPDAPGGRRVPINQPIKIYRSTEPELRTLKEKTKRPTTMKELRAKLIPLVQRLKRAKKLARKLGLFAEDRELLTCPRCGLAEDVDISNPESAHLFSIKLTLKIATLCLLNSVLILFNVL